MKKYSAPEFEMVKYDVEDCLTGSTGIDTESENIDAYLESILF